MPLTRSADLSVAGLSNVSWTPNWTDSTIKRSMEWRRGRNALDYGKSSFKIKRYFLPTKIALDINKKNPKHVKPFMNFLSSLLEESFACRSAEYDAGSKTCVLSRDDRRTQPEAFRYSLL